MPQYKLTYFNARGRAELARLLFAEAGVPFEDFRFERDQWPTIKATIKPFGQVPMLEVDGKQIPQSKAIARYLARTFKLVGKNDFESALCDAYVDAIEDSTSALREWWAEQDAEKKKAIWAKFVEDNLKPMMCRFDTILKENGTGYLVGNQLTWADIAVYDAVTYLTRHTPDLVTPYAKLSELVKKAGECPKIKAYVDKRPKTDF